MPEEKKTVTASMSIGDVLSRYPKTAAVFGKHGLHCIGCQIATYESIEAGAKAHGIEVDKLIADLNESIGTEDDKDKKNDES